MMVLKQYRKDLNPDKVELTSSTTITKDMMKSTKKYVKSLEKLKTSELIS